MNMSSPSEPAQENVNNQQQPIEPQSDFHEESQDNGSEFLKFKVESIKEFKVLDFEQLEQDSSQEKSQSFFNEEQLSDKYIIIDEDSNELATEQLQSDEGQNVLAPSLNDNHHKIEETLKESVSQEISEKGSQNQQKFEQVIVSIIQTEYEATETFQVLIRQEEPETPMKKQEQIVSEAVEIVAQAVETKVIQPQLMKKAQLGFSQRVMDLTRQSALLISLVVIAFLFKLWLNYDEIPQYSHVITWLLQMIFEFVILGLAIFSILFIALAIWLVKIFQNFGKGKKQKHHHQVL